MEIKVGQVWQNNKGEKFYIKEVCNKDLINSRVTFISLQNTDEYFAEEIGSCSYECFMYQTKNLKLISYLSFNRLIPNFIIFNYLCL